MFEFIGKELIVIRMAIPLKFWYYTLYVYSIVYCFVQVNKIEVKYDKASKQVDVQALKETLWDHIQEFTQTSVQVI